MKLMEWLSEPAPNAAELLDMSTIPEVSRDPTRLQLYAALVGINGGRTQVSGWGCHSSGGPYGWEGLTQDQALTLIALSNFIEGWLIGTDRAEQGELLAAIGTEHQRVYAIWRK